MPYATADQVRAALRLSSLPSDPDSGATGWVDQIDDTDITDAIAEGDAAVDVYIGARRVTDILKSTCSRDIAAYLLVLTWRGTDDLTADDPVVLRYRHTMSMLEDIGTGKVDPGPGPGEDPDGYNGTVVNPCAPSLTGACGAEFAEHPGAAYTINPYVSPESPYYITGTP